MNEDSKQVIVAPQHSQSLVEATLPDLMRMISEFIDNQTKVNPIYQAIQEKILERFKDDAELDNMGVKDLMKLLELSTKAQLTPVEQLTKLVQAATALYERSEIESKSKALDAIISKFDSLHDIQDVKVIHAQDISEVVDVEEIKEDDTMQDLNDIING